MVYCMVFSVVCVQGMEKAIKEKKEYLNFTLDSAYRIDACAQKNMTYYIEPQGFYGKNVFEILPLAALDRKLVEEAFEKSKKKGSARVSYTLDTERFLVRIKALTNFKQDYIFYAQVTKNKQQ